MAQKSVVNYTRTPAAEDGEFRLSDGQLALGDADLVPPAPTVQMSEPVPAAGIGFVTLPAGWPRDVDEPHVAPAWNY